MNFLHKSILILASSSILFGTAACKKAENAQVDTAKTLAAVEIAKDQWDKTKPNSLYVYVPEDTFGVVASTRQFDMDSPSFKTLYAASMKYMTAMKTSLDTRIANLSPDSEEAKFIKSQMASWENLIGETPEKWLEDWGLDQKFHTDFIGYMNGMTPVLKMTLADAAKYKAKYLDQLNRIFAAHDQPADNAPKMREVDIAGEKWSLISIRELFENPSMCILCDSSNKTKLPSTIAFHVDDKIATIALVYDEKTDVLASLLKPADKPIKPENVGKIAPTDYMIGFADLVKLSDLVLSHKELASIGFDESDDAKLAVCGNEFKSIIANIPKLNLSGSIQDNGRMDCTLTAVVKDQEELKKLQALPAAHTDLAEKAKLLGLALNLNVGNTALYLKTLSAALSARNYQCEVIREAADSVIDLTSALDEQVMGLIGMLQGINVAANAFNPNTGNMDAVIQLSGNGIDQLVPPLLTLGILVAPELASIKLEKDVVTNVDLKKLIDLDVPAQALMTSTDFVLATANNDIKALAGAAKNNDRVFFNLTATSDLFGLAYALSGSNEIDPGMLNYDISSNLLINDDGVGVSFGMLLK